MSSSSDARVIFQHPLAYLLGLEGVALLRAFAGEHDRAFTEARFKEIRELLDRAEEFGSGAEVEVMPTDRAYDGWAAAYDGEGNGCFPLEDQVLPPMLDALTPGVTIDAACGTGRVSRDENSRITRRVTDGESRASPAATRRIARRSSAGLVSLVRNPLAPTRGGLGRARGGYRPPDIGRPERVRPRHE